MAVRRNVRERPRSRSAEEMLSFCRNLAKNDLVRSFASSGACRPADIGVKRIPIIPAERLQRLRALRSGSVASGENDTPMSCSEDRIGIGCAHGRRIRALMKQLQANVRAESDT